VNSSLIARRDQSIQRIIVAIPIDQIDWWRLRLAGADRSPSSLWGDDGIAWSYATALIVRPTAPSARSK